MCFLFGFARLVSFRFLDFFEFAIACGFADCLCFGGGYSSLCVLICLLLRVVFFLL